jgi:hypothetical protein
MAIGDIEDPVDYGSTVRNNLMKRPGYRPYCMCCIGLSRMWFDGEQFFCGATKERTSFEPEFIAKYKERWKPKTYPIATTGPGGRA